MSTNYLALSVHIPLFRYFLSVIAFSEEINNYTFNSTIRASPHLEITMMTRKMKLQDNCLLK